MRFCFVDRSIGPAIWRVVGPIAATLLTKGHEVDYVRFHDGNELTGSPVPNGVKVIDIPVPPKKKALDAIRQQVQFTKAFRKYLAETKPDVVHTHFAVPSIVARWAAAREGVPFVLSTQHEIYGSISAHYRLGLRLTERFCSALIYVSNTVARSFGREAGTIEKADLKTRPAQVVIPNGVDANQIRSVVSNAPKKVAGKLVCVGRMVPVKGQGLLLNALRKIVPQYPQTRLTLIGSGPEEAHLRALTHDLGLEKQVEFKGWLPHDQVLMEMASAGLVVVPSSRVQEGFGLVLAEGLICGTPLLVSDTPLFHEILDPFLGRGAFFKEGDSEALAQGLEQHLSGKAPYPSSLKPMTKEEAAPLSANTMAASYMSLYQTLFNGRR